jgi:hypothetical protein
MADPGDHAQDRCHPDLVTPTATTREDWHDVDDPATGHHAGR